MPIITTALSFILAVFVGSTANAQMVSTSEPVTASKYMAATANPYATDAALEVLRAGGSAVDAAIAAGAFEQVLVEQVEPHLGNGRPTVLEEYPLACSGLSRPIPGRPNRVERWELYVAGLELGNACSELTDPDEQAARFAACAALRRSESRPVYPMDEPFMDALRAGLPPAAGIAIGLDRLLLILANRDDLADTVAFP